VDHVHKAAFLIAALLAAPSLAFAGISMTYPLHESFEDGAVVQAGFISPGQTFDVVFSNDSGYGYKWDSLEVLPSGLPAGWRVESIQRTDPSLVAKISVPRGTGQGIYDVVFRLSASSQPGASESVQARIVARNNLLVVSFSRNSDGEFVPVGGTEVYSVKLTNPSIASMSVRVGSGLPSNWFAGKYAELKPGTSIDLDLNVTPLSSGRFPFSFYAFSVEEDVVVQSYSSELRAQPTLKGKLGSPLSGFPFFTFTLLPFQLFGSFFSLLLP